MGIRVKIQDLEELHWELVLQAKEAERLSTVAPTAHAGHAARHFARGMRFAIAHVEVLMAAQGKKEEK
jgi:hypothetical protein